MRQIEDNKYSMLDIFEADEASLMEIMNGGFLWLLRLALVKQLPHNLYVEKRCLTYYINFVANMSMKTNILYWILALQVKLMKGLDTSIRVNKYNSTSESSMHSQRLWDWFSEATLTYWWNNCYVNILQQISEKLYSLYEI